MTKKFTFLIAALILLTMMVLPGKVWADDDPYYTLTPVATGANSSPHNTYTEPATVTISKIEWSVTGNSYMVPWRIGGKSLSGVNREVYSKTAMGSVINEVTLQVGAASSITVNSLKLIVDNDSDFSSPIDEVTVTFSANSTLSFKPTSPATSWAKDAYYKFVFNVSVSGTSNKFVEFTEAKFYAPSYTITAQSNNTDYGTVSLSGNVITASPEEGYTYAAPAYTVTSGMATVSQSGNEFTVTPSSDCIVTINFEAIPAYTVTLGDDGSTLTEATAGAGVTLPSRSNIGDYTFVGWSTTDVVSETTTAPTIISTGSYTPTANITLYPVYTRTASTVIDKLDRALTGITGTDYTAWSGKTSVSSAVYAGQSAGGNESIQLRSKNSNSGIVTTSSGGKAKKVTITWESHTDNGRTVDVYGKNTAYSAASELYGDNKGTKLGSIVYGTSTELTISGDYEFIGLRSNSGALYLTEVDITWSANTPTTYYASGSSYSMSISAWTTEPIGGWYLIAAPVGTTAAGCIGNLFSNSYDLYRFNQAAESEWENWKQTEVSHYHFDLEPGRGYLYANSANVTLTFLNQSTATDDSKVVTLTYSDANSNTNIHGWNLIGNPFATTATIKDSDDNDKPYYRMNADHTDLITSTTTGNVNALEGIFVHTDSGEDVTFTKTSSKRDAESNNNNIVINLNDGKGTVIDRAIVRFDEGETLPKFQLRNSSTKIYIPQNGTDYAIAAMDDNTQAFSLNFHAKTTGKYTLSLGETSDLNYVHIFDRMTGEDVDMLLEDSYSFIGSPADSEERFIVRLSYNASSTGSETFAYQSGNDIIVNGEGTLEVYDVTGRKVMATTINGIETINGLNSGVYVFRVIGETLKTQKIVVR